MTPLVLLEMGARLSDLAHTLAPDAITHVVITEAGDGSRRVVAVVTSVGKTDLLEQTFRILTPPPPDAPAWARSFDWTTEVKAGDGDWLEVG